MREALEAALKRAWRHRGPLATALLPLSLVYGGAAALRRRAYRAGWLDSASAGVPLIVVGNLVAGGAGKTPVVLELLRHLKSRGIAAGVVSRGHGRKRSRTLPDVREVLAGSSAGEAGDEPLLIRRRSGVPVFVGRDRIGAARALRARHPQVQVILSDDGLQHLALRRDAEICVQGEQGAGNGWLLPAGPLRERRRQVTWVLDAQREAAQEAPAALASGGHFALRRHLADHALCADGTRVALASLCRKPVAAVAAVAEPQSFFLMLRAAGLTLAECCALPDHDDFAHFSGPRDDAHVLVCTEKDAVKLWPKHPTALAVPLELEIEPAFFRALDSWLEARGVTPPSAPL